MPTIGEIIGVERVDEELPVIWRILKQSKTVREFVDVMKERYPENWKRWMVAIAGIFPEISDELMLAAMLILKEVNLEIDRAIERVLELDLEELKEVWLLVAVGKVMYELWKQVKGIEGI